MKRGLRRTIAVAVAAAGGTGLNHRPDEEGIETVVLGLWWPNGDTPCLNHRPDEEGIETLGCRPFGRRGRRV